MNELEVGAIRNVVLVHGGFVDGSGWAGVYSILRKAGYRVSVVQNPTISLADDVAVTRRALAQQDGPAILVGHSYGGVVITEAGNDAKVAGLVYVAAFAPDRGESVNTLIKDPPADAPASADPPAARRFPFPRPGEVSRVVCGGSGLRCGCLPCRLAGAVGRRCAERHRHDAGVANQTELVRRCNARIG